MCCSFNSIFVLIIVYSIVIMLVASPSFPSAFAFIRALLVIHESARSLFFKPQMTAICHVCLFRIFKRFLCMFHWPLYFFSSASRKSTAEHFNSPFLLFTVSFRLGLGFVRSCVSFSFFTSSLADVISSKNIRPSKISRETHCNPFGFDNKQ